MKILVTGGAGYIGSHVVYELNQLGYDVLVLDNLSKGNAKNIFPNNEFIQGDLSDDTLLNQIFEKKIDVIFHFAAWKAAGESMQRPEKYALNNINGTLKLLTKAIQYHCKNFIFSSSAAVYGIPKFLPITEQHPLCPINYYGYTKLAIEENLEWFEKLHNLKFVSLRYFNAVGYHTNGKIQGLETDPANLFPIIMEVILQKQKVLQIFGNDYDTPDGTCIRDYIHVTDLAKAHIFSLDYILKHQKSLIINLGTEKGFSIFDVIKATEQIIQKKIPTKIVKRREGDSKEILASYQKAQELLNWQPQFSDLTTIIQSMWHIYKPELCS